MCVFDRDTHVGHIKNARIFFTSMKKCFFLDFLRHTALAVYFLSSTFDRDMGAGKYFSTKRGTALQKPHGWCSVGMNRG